MIESPLVYLFSLALLATVFHQLDSRTSWKVFKYIPAIVFIYAFSMFFASMGLFDKNEEIDSIYKLTKINLLPAMLFLMLLQVDFKHFFKLGKSLLISY
ncbi:MAG: putative membrane protein, partial [Sulfurimonas sp.]